MKRTPARTMFALLLAVVLVLGLAAPAMAATTMRSVQKLTVNGEAVECDKYNIDGYNYFKLRDLAKLLDGTNSQFNVDYDKAAKMMVVTTGVPYTTPNGTELQVGEDQSASAVPSVQSLMIDGEMREDLTAYNIGGNNYFQLRELGKALHFYVHYDAASKTMLVDESEEDEAWDTGDAGLDNPRNQDGIGEKEILVVSFGTSFNDSRVATIGAVEAAMEKAFPEMSVRRGFTAQIVIDHIALRDDETIDNFTQALDRAVANGVKELYVQPTHLMDGFEYNDVKAELAEYADKFDVIALGDPILTTDEDYDIVIEAITEATKQYDDGKTAICFMGHGTEADSNHVYADMQAKLTEKGYANYYVGTVEAEPSVYDVLEAVKAGGYTKVVLRPLMIVAGDHANNDMADLEDEESWASIFTAAGYEVECVLEGLGQLPAIQDLLVDHMKAAIGEPAEEEDEENYETGDASLDNPRNQDGMGHTELLVVSFGTSFNDSRRLTIGAIEEAMEKAFPGYDVRRGFTAQIVIDHIARRDGEVIDNFTEALDRAVRNGVSDLLVQPTHLMDGFEYNDVKEELAKYEGKFDNIVLGAPLLTSDEDYDIVIEAITEATKQYDDGKTAICFMGHGTEAESNHVYADMQAKLTEKGYANYYVGTVEAEPSVYDVLEAVKAGGYTKVVLRPLMIVAGDHANNDMADLEDEESWASIFTAAGYEVECVLEGLGQLPAIQDLLVDHIRTAAAEALEEDYDTGDASLDDPRNADGIGEKELLVISFGTSFNDSRVATIGAIEKAMEDAIPGYAVRRGFTADIVINHIARRDGEIIDNVARALDRAVENGVKQLVVQPTHLMDGFEYNDVKEALMAYVDKFDRIRIGKPILNTEEDYDTVIAAITEATAQYDDGKTAICFMGHGTEADSNHVYADMQAKLTEKGYANYYVGTVEAEPSVYDVLEAVKAGGYTKVVLRPLMIVAGDHANNDMADLEDEESWASIFTAAGYEVECVLEGLGQLPAIQKLLVEHARDAEVLVPERAINETSDESVAKEGAEPITGDKLNDGTYEITVNTGAKMFKVVKALLTVKDGEMTAVLTLSGSGYSWFYVGEADGIADADYADFIPAVINGDGYTFEIPVEALDQVISCAAYSRAKDAWYPRNILFDADTLPEGALK